MTIYDEIKKIEEKLSLLKLALKEKEENDKTYGRLALASDESKFSAGTYGEVIDIDPFGYFYDGMRQGRTFTTAAAAERFIKAERLAFKCRQAMAKSWGDTVIDWEDDYQCKYSLRMSRGYFEITHGFDLHHRFSFKTMIDAQNFINSHKEKDIILMLKGGDV